MFVPSGTPVKASTRPLTFYAPLPEAHFLSHRSSYHRPLHLPDSVTSSSASCGCAATLSLTPGLDEGLSLGLGELSVGTLLLFQAMVKIEDMAVSLILEEWGCQNLARRNLSRDSRQENYGNVFSQGKRDAGLCSGTSDVFS